MRKDKENAFNLRKAGKSYTEIHSALKIPKATLSDWFKEVDWSKQLKKELSRKVREGHTTRLIGLNKIRGEHLKTAYEEARNEARSEFEKLKYNPLFIAGIMLYWGEGDKLTKYSTKIANTDPDLIRLYVFFLRNACRIPEDKIKAHLLIYPDLDADTCKDYWARKSGVSTEHFFNTTTIQGKHKVRRLRYGVCMIGVSSTYFKVKMLEWIKLLPEELMNRAYYENIEQLAGMV